MRPRLVPFQTSGACLKKNRSSGRNQIVPESRRKQELGVGAGKRMWQIIELRRNHPILQIMTACFWAIGEDPTEFSVRIAILSNISMFPRQILPGGHWHLLTFPSSSAQQKSGWPPD
ncbi:hypothetical protein quinque_015995 [Culex quinquefasciatus]